MTQAADDVWMTHAIERDGFVLEVGNQRVFEIFIGRVLQKHVQRLDDYCFRSAVGGGVVARHVDLRIAAAPQTFNDVETPIEPALL